jgi:hypothetical protein
MSKLKRWICKKYSRNFLFYHIICRYRIGCVAQKFEKKLVKNTLKLLKLNKEANKLFAFDLKNNDDFFFKVVLETVSCTQIKDAKDAYAFLKSFGSTKPMEKLLVY